jgi:hypothetical protein
MLMLLFLSVQALNLFVNMICCYLMLARTWYFEAGLFGLLVSKFRGIFWIVPINFLVSMGMRGYYIVRLIFMKLFYGGGSGSDADGFRHLR